MKQCPVAKECLHAEANRKAQTFLTRYFCPTVLPQPRSGRRRVATASARHRLRRGAHAGQAAKTNLSPTHRLQPRSNLVQGLSGKALGHRPRRETRGQGNVQGVGFLKSCGPSRCSKRCTGSHNRRARSIDHHEAGGARVQYMPTSQDQTDVCCSTLL